MVFIPIFFMGINKKRIFMLIQLSKKYGTCGTFGVFMRKPRFYAGLEGTSFYLDVVPCGTHFSENLDSMRV